MNPEQEIQIEVSNTMLISVTELNELRETCVQTVKRIDHILSTKSLKGKTLAEFIVNGVCSYYKISLSDFRKVSRTPKIVLRRQMTAHILKQHTDRSLSDIAEILGYINHATIIYHIKQTTDYLSDEVYGNKEVKKEYGNFVKYLKL